jgi:hypothetical protein
MIREKLRGFGAKFWDLIGFIICFCNEKCVDRFHELVDQRCSRSTMDPRHCCAQSFLGARPPAAPGLEVTG